MTAYRVQNVGAVLGGDAFLIITSGKTALVDTGFSFTAPQMVENLKVALNGRPLDYIILTHSHYDHVSGASACKKEWKDAKIVSSQHAAEVFEKPSAVERMRQMNIYATKAFGYPADSYSDMSALHTDIVVKEGDIIDLGPITLRTMEAPGHTWDCLAFWCPEEKMIITCETMGVISGEDSVMPACLVSYAKTMEFIAREKALSPQAIMVPHYGMLYGKDCTKFLDNAVIWNTKYHDMIVDGYGKGLNVEQLKALTKSTFYTDVVRQGQPEEAFDLNNSYMVPMMLRECCGWKG